MKVDMPLNKETKPNQTKPHLLAPMCIQVKQRFVLFSFFKRWHVQFKCRASITSRPIRVLRQQYLIYCKHYQDTPCEIMDSNLHLFPFHSHTDAITVAHT